MRLLQFPVLWVSGPVPGPASGGPAVSYLTWRIHVRYLHRPALPRPGPYRLPRRGSCTRRRERGRPQPLLVRPPAADHTGLYVPEQLSTGMVEIRSYSDDPTFLPAGWPVARASRVVHSAVVFCTRYMPAAPAPASPASGAERGPPSAPLTPPACRFPAIPCLTDGELKALCELLAEYADRFNDGSEALQAANLLQARINTVDVAALSSPPRRLAPAMREEAGKAVTDLDAQGVAEPSTSPRSVLIVLVRKASGAPGACAATTARSTNTFTFPSSPSPALTTSWLPSGASYFSVLDLCSGFYQGEIAKEDRPGTSFVTSDPQRQ
ncbi:hypothetical protein ACSSS7_006754 [Eimeria intestinalis]